MDEELIQIKLDPIDEIKKSKKSITKIVSEAADKNPIERSLLLLSKGDAQDQLNVVYGLPYTLNYNQKEVFDRILPKIVGVLCNKFCDLENGDDTYNTYKKNNKSSLNVEKEINGIYLVKNEFVRRQRQLFNGKLLLLFEHSLTLADQRTLVEIVTRELSVQELYSIALEGLQHKDFSVVTAWANTLILSIPSLPSEDVQYQILPPILKQVSSIDVDYTKIELIRVIGVCCQKTHANVIESCVLPIIFKFSSDPVPEIRGITCLQYPIIAKNIAETSKLAPCVEAFCGDKHPLVRGTLLAVIGQMIPFFSKELLKRTFIPLIIDLINNCMTAADDTTIILAKLIGSYFENMAKFFEPNQLDYLVNCYQKLSKYDLSASEAKNEDSSRIMACQQQCAVNLPIIAKFIMNCGVPRYHDVLFKIIRSLATDPCFIVRRLTVDNFHTIAINLGSSVDKIKDVFLKLLRDTSEEVIFSLVKNLHPILKQFYTFNSLHNKMDTINLTEFTKHLLICQTTVFKSHKWRMKYAYIEQLEFLPYILPFDYIIVHFWSPLLGMITASGVSRPVREQAGRGTLKFLKKCQSEEIRKNVRLRLIKEVAKNDSSYIRRIFISICQDCFDMFSIQYFSEHFAATLISLLDDPVPNVRLEVISTLPKLKKMLKVAPSLEIVKLMEDRIKHRYETETDKDCQQLLNCVFLQINNTNLDINKDKQYEAKNLLLYQEEKEEYTHMLPTLY